MSGLGVIVVDVPFADVAAIVSLARGDIGDHHFARHGRRDILLPLRRILDRIGRKKVVDAMLHRRTPGE